MDEVREEELTKLRAIADYQFGRGAGQALFEEGIKVVRSPRTGRIRGVYYKGKLIATIRANDGLIALTIHGAKRLMKVFKPPKLRVVVSKVASKDIAKGRSVFAKHVVNVDPEIRAGEEVIVVNEEDRLLAVGKALLSAKEMMAFKRGVAVKVRKGINEEEHGD
ncbi:MAG: pseudouridine synthase [Thermofilum sp. ex4484_15]|nr:MAG: pseudouridine synthase [Thermofilum sp. ex4484_15]